MLVTMGQMVAYLVGWILSTRAHGWRFMVGLGAAPAVLQFGLLLFLPETPRWLFKNGQAGAARSVLGRVYDGSELMVDEVIRAMEQEILEEEAIHRLSFKSPSGGEASSWLRPHLQTWRELFWNGGNRRALAIACLLQGLQQLCGFVCWLPGNPFYEVMMRTDNLSEFAHVFLSNHIFLDWILVSYIDLSLHRRHQLPRHPRCLYVDRPHRPSADPPGQPSRHDQRPPPLLHLVPIPRPPDDAPY